MNYLRFAIGLSCIVGGTVALSIGFANATFALIVAPTADLLIAERDAEIAARKSRQLREKAAA